MKLSRLNLIIFFLFLISNNALAQLGFFAVETRGCAPFTVNIQEQVDTTQVDVPTLLYNFLYNPGDPLSGITDTNFTYTQPGIYNILQLGNVNGQGQTFLRENYIEVLSSPTPTYKVFKCDSNRINIAITEDVYEEYIIKWNSNDSVIIAGFQEASFKFSTPGTKSISIRGNYVPGNCGTTVNFDVSTIDIIQTPTYNSFTFQDGSQDSILFDFATDESVSYLVYESKDSLNSFDSITTFEGSGAPINYQDSTIANYCYYLRSVDGCLNEKFSDTLCAVQLSTVAENNRNLVFWNAYANNSAFASWELIKDGNSVFTGSDMDSINVFIDSQVVCNQEYCYRISANHKNSRASISNEICIKGLSLDTPSAVSRMNVSIENNLTEISWLEDTLAEVYNIKRGFTQTSVFDSVKGSGNYSTVGPDQDLPRICYAVDFLDACKNRSISTRINCPVELTVENAPNGDRLVEWLAYSGWPNGAAIYILEKLDENDQVYFSLEFSPDTLEYRDQGLDETLQKLRYRVRAESNDSIPLISYSQIFEIEQEFGLVFPNAFSPNNDGLNDVFGPVGFFAEEYTLQIFNHWGQVIFVSKDPADGWDGTINERDAPEGVYVFKVDATDEQGRPFAKKGSVTLIR